MKDYEKWIELDKAQILQNVKLLKNNTNHELIAVIKANGYGLGMTELIKILDDEVGIYAVANLSEAKKVRKHSQKPVLILGYVKKSKELINKNFILSINSLNWLFENEEFLVDNQIELHLKINLGMNRNGLTLSEINKINPKLKITGVFGHLECYENSDYTQSQINQFQKIITQYNYQNLNNHVVASYRFLYHNDNLTKFIRPGHNITFGDCKDLKKAFTIKSKVVNINYLKKGEAVGYDHQFLANHDNTMIAVIPVGYGDGFLRSNKGNYVKIKGIDYQIIGNVCMDYFFVLIDHRVSINDEVIIYDNLEKSSEHNHTIDYELITLLNNRFKRIIV